MKYNRIIHNICLYNDENEVSKRIFDNCNEQIKDKIILDKLTIQKQRDELRQFSLELNSNTESSFQPTGIEEVDEIIKYVDNLKAYTTWCELAKEYFKMGYFNYCKDYSL